MSHHRGQRIKLLTPEEQHLHPEKLSICSTLIRLRDSGNIIEGHLKAQQLVLKKDPSVILDFDIGRIFKGHNILEYKRPDDKLNIDVFAKVMAYANLYKSQGIPVNAISYNDISATLFRHSYPRDAFQQLKEHGAVIEEKYPGVYYVMGMSPFPIQILVGRQLDPKEYAMFRVIRSGASDDEIRNFKNMAIRNRDAAYQKSVDNVFWLAFPPTGKAMPG